MEGSWDLGSLRPPLYPHHPHPCPPFSNWGPETVTVRETYMTRKRKLVSYNISPNVIYKMYFLKMYFTWITFVLCHDEWCFVFLSDNFFELTNYYRLLLCLCFPCSRNEWGPPDRKVDTRKYRAEPKSIFEYEPGKSSILEQERPVSIFFK